MKVTTLSLFLVCLVSTAAGECPSGFIHLGEGCYLFGQDPFVQSEASDYCLGLGANLASFDSCGDFVQIARYLDVSGPDTQGLNFWVGASRVGDKWSWMDTGADLPFGAPLWDAYKEVQETHACALMPAEGNFLFSEACNEVGLPLCETPLPASAAAPSKPKKTERVTCPDPFTPVGDRCIYVNDEFMTWDDARTACQEMAAGFFTDLLVLQNCETLSSVARYLEQRNTTRRDWLWVGARDFQQDGGFRWVTGEYANPGVPFWCPLQPDNFMENQQCVMLWGSRYFYGADEDCSEVRKSVCEVEL